MTDNYIVSHSHTFIADDKTDRQTEDTMAYLVFLQDVLLPFYLSVLQEFLLLLTELCECVRGFSVFDPLAMLHDALTTLMKLSVGQRRTSDSTSVTLQPLTLGPTRRTSGLSSEMT